MRYERWRDDDDFWSAEYIKSIEKIKTFSPEYLYEKVQEIEEISKNLKKEITQTTSHGFKLITELANITRWKDWG